VWVECQNRVVQLGKARRAASIGHTMGQGLTRARSTSKVESASESMSAKSVTAKATTRAKATAVVVKR
jgi:hypothetical protein